MDVVAVNSQIRRRIPSFRNREVFAEVVVKGRFKTEIAAQFGLSQPRISQIVEQVRDWLRQVVGSEGENWPAEHQVQYAKTVTEMRLSHQLREALGAWEQSKQKKVVLRESLSASGELPGSYRTTSDQSPKSSHIHQALQLTLAIARVVGVDVSGKSIRDEVARQRKLAAQTPVVVPTTSEPETQPAAAEVLKDFEELKPLWNSEGVEAAAEVQTEEQAVTTSSQPMVCTETLSVEDASISLCNGAENSYKLEHPDSAEDWQEPYRNEEFNGEDWEEVEKCYSDQARRELLAMV